MSALRLGMVQMTSEADERDKNVKRGLAFIDQAADQGADVVMLPEFFNTEYFAQYWDSNGSRLAEPETGYTIESLREKAREREIFIAAAIYEFVGPGLYFDTLFLVNPGGDIVGKYRKTHPAAMRSVETLFYRAGTQFPVWDIGGFKVGGIICYDHFFPEAARCAAIAGAEVLLGPFATMGIPVWEELMRVRAFENGLYMAPCNKVGLEGSWIFSGKSMVVGPRGEVLYCASGTRQDVFVVELQREQVVSARVPERSG